MDLFSQQSQLSNLSGDAPLSARMRPRSLDEIAGQTHLLAEGKLLRRTLQSKQWTSMIFYGPPGVGKTTLAQMISRMSDSVFIPLNAVASNVAELRKVIKEAKRLRGTQGTKTILFVDEIHRFNKSQQDVLMPDVENGILVLIGATTHNPSFSINGPLLSRSIIFELKPLTEEELISLLKRALADEDHGLGLQNINITEEALSHLAKNAAGDARRALNSLEVGALTTPPGDDGVIHFDLEVAQESCQRKVVYYDNNEDYHYDTISAFIKSIRGSDVDSAVYWLAKMIYAGEDPRFIMRRLLILASEDIGNADPQALILASSGLQAVEFVGLPEAQIILSQLVTYMALAPKSNASYKAISDALEDVKTQKTEEVPPHLRDGHYKGAKRLDRGEGYQYAHSQGDGELAVTGQKHIATKKTFYEPKNSGFEKTLRERVDWVRKRQK